MAGSSRVSRGQLYRARLPSQYEPELLQRQNIASTSDRYEVKAGFNLPWATIEWRGPANLWLSLVDTELEMDMGGVWERVEVDGVRGWLTRLGAGDFLEPGEREARSAQSLEWRYDRRIYSRLSSARRDITGGVPWGDAIALQWNRDGIHYLLIAQDWEPVTVDELLKMANSMAPSDIHLPASVSGLSED